MSARGRREASKTTLAQVLVCLLLATAIPSYGLDLRCALSLDPCVSVDCCSDCGISAPTVDRFDQTAPKFEPQIAMGACSVALVNATTPELFEYPSLDLRAPVRPARLFEPNRGPPCLPA